MIIQLDSDTPDLLAIQLEPQASEVGYLQRSAVTQSRMRCGQHTAAMDHPSNMT